MSAKSKNKYDVYMWIKNEVIPSCTSIEQNITCEKLIRNFQEVYNDCELSRQLMFECVDYDFIIN
jgi:hypothetical protein